MAHRIGSHGSKPKYERVILSPGEPLTAAKLRQMEQNAAHVQWMLDRAPKGFMGINIRTDSVLIAGEVIQFAVEVNVEKNRAYRARWIDPNRITTGFYWRIYVNGVADDLMWSETENAVIGDGVAPQMEGIYFSDQDATVWFYWASTTDFDALETAHFFTVEDIGVWNE